MGIISETSYEVGFEAGKRAALEQLSSGLQTTVHQAHIGVLDKGYVRYIDHMGTDLSVVNAARASYEKESLEFENRDEKLLHFLVRENHTSPFRHAVISFEINAPLMIARQWYKHVVGSMHDEAENDPFFAWNEASRRYVTEDEKMYLPQPGEWRRKPANSKQGSGGPLSEAEGKVWTKTLDAYQKRGLELYHMAMESGVAPEQARLFLAAYGLYVKWRWTTSLAAVVHFIQLREAHDAQGEIQQYASAVKDITAVVFPKSVALL